MTKLPLAAAACLALAGCAGLQSVKVAQLPRELSAGQPALSEARPARDDVAPRSYEVADRSTFFLQRSGGSVGLGVALGAIGAAINVANIDRITNELGEAGAASGLYQIDAREEARAVLRQASPARAGAAPSLTVKPYVVYLVADETVGVETLVAFRAESALGDERKWLGNYTYCLPGALPLESFKKPLSAQQLAAQREGMRRGYAELYQELLADLNGKAPAKQDVARVQSRVSGVVAIPGNVSRNGAGHLVLRAMWGDWDRTYNATIFAADTQYTFADGPAPREQRPERAEESTTDM